MHDWVPDTLDLSKLRTYKYAYGTYERKYVKKLIQAMKVEHLTNSLNKTSLTGSGYSKPVQLFAQSFGLPTQVTWSLEGRHDFYCGIFTSTGDKFLCGSHDGTIRVFDSSQKYFRLIKEINYPFPHWSVVSMNLSRDERCLAYSLLACNVYLSSLDDVSGGNEVSLIGQSHNQRGISKTFAVCFDGSGTHLYTGHNAGFFGVYDIPTGSSECVPVSPSATRDVNAVTTIDPGGNVLLTGGDDTNIRLFDTRALNKGALAVFVGHMDGITYLDTNADGYYFLSNSKDQTVRLWDLRKHTKPGTERQLRPRCNWDYRLHSVPRIYDNPRHMESGSSRGDQSLLTLRGHTVRFTLIRARFSPVHITGQRYAYAGSTMGGWCIWDLFTGKLLHRNSHGSQAVRDVHWHPWEPMAIASELNGSLTCWKCFPRNTSDSIDDSVDEPLTVSERDQFDRADPDGSLYRHRLEECGLRYRFPRQDANYLSDTSLSSMYAEESEETSSTDSDGYHRVMFGNVLGTSDEDDPDFPAELSMNQDEPTFPSLPTTRSQTQSRRRRSRPPEFDSQATDHNPCATSSNVDDADSTSDRPSVESTPQCNQPKRRTDE